MRDRSHRFKAGLWWTVFHVHEKSPPWAGLEPVASISQAHSTTALPRRLTPIPRYCYLFQRTPASRMMLTAPSRMSLTCTL